MQPVRRRANRNHTQLVLQACEFDPSPPPSSSSKPDRSVKVENRMVYVIAFEEDGYARDVTPRYAREFGAKVAKMQQGGKGRQQWWEQIMSLLHRPYRLVCRIW